MPDPVLKPATGEAEQRTQQLPWPSRPKVPSPGDYASRGLGREGQLTEHVHACRPDGEPETIGPGGRDHFDVDVPNPSERPCALNEPGPNTDRSGRGLLCREDDRVIQGLVTRVGEEVKQILHRPVEKVRPTTVVIT
jgi:hypothetical protein